MGFLQFTAAVIQSLAWPITVLVLVFLMRRPIGRILLAATKLRYKDLELDFGRELKEVGETVKSLDISVDQNDKSRFPSGSPKGAPELLDEAKALAEDFPEPAVAVAWSAIEGDLLVAVERITNTDIYRRQSPGRSIEMLSDSGAIEAETVEVLRRMQNLRNIAVHERWNAFGGISSDEAFEFIALAERMHGKLGSLDQNDS